VGLLLRKSLLSGSCVGSVQGYIIDVVSLDNEAAGSPDLERVRPPLNLVGWNNGNAFLHLDARTNHLSIGREAIANVVIHCIWSADDINSNNFTSLRVVGVRN